MRYKIDPLTGGLLPAQNDSTVSISSSTGGSGIVESIVAGANVIVDSTDQANPIVSATGGGGTTDHSALSNLDYASAGHTGFQPAGAYLTDISGQDLSTANNTTSAFITAGDIPAIPDSVDDLSPSQTGNNGKFLKTDGTNATWESIPSGGDMLAATYDPAGGAEQVAFASDLATVATTGAYSDLSGTPFIPTQYTDELAQDAVGNAVGNGLDYDDTTGAISVDETELTHNSLGSKQGGTTNEYYHLTSAEVSGLHAAATVADSTSIDMSITGQQISAAAIFGTDAGTVCQGNDARLSDARTPVAHNQAESTITFTNITTGNATTSAHGYVPIATAPASGLYNYVGITNGETAYTNKALFDATVPSTQAFGDSASTGSATVAARRDHKHAMPAAPTNATTVTVANEASDTTCFPVFVTAATGDLAPKTRSTLKYNSSTNGLELNSVTLWSIVERYEGEGILIDGMQVKDGLVVGGSATGVANSSLSTTAGDIGGVWKTWTLNLAGVSGTASSTITNYYTQIGKTIHYYIVIVFGGTDKPNGNMTYSLPATARTVTRADNMEPHGIVDFQDQGVNTYSGKCRATSTTAGQILVDATSGSYHSYAAVSGTAPFAWGANDGLVAKGTYEAA